MPPISSTPPHGSAGERRGAVLFYSINGAGLGHLVQSLAIARRLEGFSPVMVTTSQRADVLDRYGFPYRVVASLGDATGRPSQEAIYSAVRRMVVEHDVCAIVADGAAWDPGLRRAWRELPQLGRIGVRRAYRLDGRQHRIAASDRDCDLLLVPHEIGSETIPLPRGPKALWVGSIGLVDRDELLPREKARRALGLPSEGPAVLVHLGAGAIGAGPAVRRWVLDELAGTDAVAVVASYDPTTRGTARETDHRVIHAHRFPLAQFVRAFDAAVGAAGLNTFNEFMHLGVPSLLVPNEATISDDQAARARRAERAGAALVARESDESAVRSGVERLMNDAELRRRLAENASALVPRNGAEGAAQAVASFAWDVLGRRSGPRD